MSLCKHKENGIYVVSDAKNGSVVKSTYDPFEWIYHGHYQHTDKHGNMLTDRLFINDELYCENASNLSPEEKTFLALQHNIKFLS